MRTLAQISDLHFGRHSAPVAAALLASLASQDPDLVILSGDLTQRARRSEFLQAQAFLRQIAAPKLVVPGNHDVPLYDLYSRFVAPLTRFQAYIAPSGLP